MLSHQQSAWLNDVDSGDNSADNESEDDTSDAASFSNNDDNPEDPDYAIDLSYAACINLVFLLSYRGRLSLYRA